MTAATADHGWWITVGFAIALVIACALLDRRDRRRRQACWLCGAKRGETHRRGCRMEAL